MLGALVALTLATSAASPHEVAAADRRVLPVVILSVSESMEMTSRTDLLRRIDGEARTRAELDVELLPGADACIQDTSVSERFPCLARSAARGDRPNVLDKILIVSVAAGSSGDRFSAVLLDVRIANEISQEASGADLGAELRRRAIIARARPLDATIPDDVQRFVGRLFDDAFLGAYGPNAFGAIELHLRHDGYELRVDGQTLSGVGLAPVTRIVRVRPGRRQVEIRHPTLLPEQTTLEVPLNGVVKWEPSTHSKDRTPVVVNHVVRWTGVAAVLVGAGFGVYALASSSDTEPHCLDLGGMCTNTPSTARYVGHGDAAHDEIGSASGVRYSSLAFGLGAFGLTAAVSNLLLAEDERYPWLEIGLALVAGAVGVGASYIAP